MPRKFRFPRWTNTKTKGELAESIFVVKAKALGLAVSQPLGDNEADGPGNPCLQEVGVPHTSRFCSCGHSCRRGSDARREILREALRMRPAGLRRPAKRPHLMLTVSTCAPVTT